MAYWPLLRLAHELALDVAHRLANRLAVSDLRLANVGLDAELTLHAVDNDFQVQLAMPEMMVCPLSRRCGREMTGLPAPDDPVRYPSSPGRLGLGSTA